MMGPPASPSYPPAQQLQEVRLGAAGGVMLLAVQGYSRPVQLAIGLLEAVVVVYAAGVESRRPSTANTWARTLQVGNNSHLHGLRALGGACLPPLKITFRQAICPAEQPWSCNQHNGVVIFGGCCWLAECCCSVVLISVGHRYAGVRGCGGAGCADAPDGSSVLRPHRAAPA